MSEDFRVPAFFAWGRAKILFESDPDGLSSPLADFSVTIHPSFDPRAEEIDGNPESGKQWFLADLSIADGYRATLAFERSDSCLKICSEPTPLRWPA